MKTKLLKPHKKDCGALYQVKQGWWKSPWCSFQEYTLWRAKDGSKRGRYHVWTVVRCNCSDCPGELMVNFEEDLPSK